MTLKDDFLLRCDVSNNVHYTAVLSNTLDTLSAVIVLLFMRLMMHVVLRAKCVLVLRV